MKTMHVTLSFIAVSLVALFAWAQHFITPPSCNELVGDRDIDEWLIRTVNSSLESLSDAPHPVVVEVDVTYYGSHPILSDLDNLEESYGYIATTIEGRVGTSSARIHCGLLDANAHWINFN